MRRPFLAAGTALAAVLTGCTVARSPADRPVWNGESVRESVEEFASLCADPAGRPGPGAGVPPVSPDGTTAGGAPGSEGWAPTDEGDSEPLPPLPQGAVVVFCMYDPYPATTAPVPEEPSCPPRLVSAVRSRPGIAWAFAPDGTPVPFPYPQPEALGEGNCAPVADGVRARLWR